MKNAFIGFNLENSKEVNYNLNNLTQHAAVLGTTGSGKTVMCKVLIEEALAQGIPVLAIDPKGDIGGLGTISKNFDFRPFVSNPEKTQTIYVSNLHNIDKLILDKLSKTKTKIFTPKSSIGIQVSLIPKLTAPKDFKKEIENNPSIAASLIEPLSESICQLAGISNNYEKSKSLISSIILHNWKLGNDLTIESLINEVIDPPFENVGNLNLEDFLKKQERLKIASLINLILSSPSKQAWKSGQEIKIEKLLEPGNLSIFDLRYTQSLEDKQYAVEQILQEIYRFLLNKGGTDKLKFILYIDELAGLFPPPPASPPCKKSLETLIRQARAFGLGIIIATQNPGDIDYKVFGNIGTRFIGKLRTENDMDKVATAIGVSLSFLKQALLSFKTGDFFYNNSVENKSQKIHCRWLYSYHSGPLNDKEISWVNYPESKPIIEKPLELLTYPSKNQNIEKKYQDKYSLETINKLKDKISKYSNKFQTLIADIKSNEYVPYLSIIIEPKPFKGKSFDSIGPYIFDLTKKTEKTDLQLFAWKKIKKYNFKILKPKLSIKKLIYYSIKDSQKQLKKRLYKSKVVDIMDEEKNKVIKYNYDFMGQELDSAIKVITEKYKRKEAKILKTLKVNSKKLTTLRNQLRAIKAGRLIRKMFGNKRLSERTKKMKKIGRAIKKIKNKGKLIRLKIKKNKQEKKEKIKAFQSKLYQKSHTLTKSLSYNPSKSDLIVHTNILLVPANNVG